MRKNVFWKTTLRSPLISIILIVLIGMLSFSFGSRVIEYVVVHQEIERLADKHRVIGSLTSEEFDVTEGAELLSQNQYVESTDRLQSYWGVMSEFYNLDLQAADPVYNQENNVEILFWGELVKLQDSSNGNEACDFIFEVKELLTGYPDYAKEGIRLRVCYTPESAEQHDEILGNMVEGETYLVRAYYDKASNGNWPGYEEWLQRAPSRSFVMRPVKADGTAWILDREAGNEILSELLNDSKYMLDEVNRHGMAVRMTDDMSALPDVQEISEKMYLVKGRLLDHADSEVGAAVCVIQEPFANARGIEVGDSIEFTFRQAKELSGSAAVGDADAENWQNYDTFTQSYMVVGICNYMQLYENMENPSSYNNKVFIPNGSVPVEFAYPADVIYMNDFSFILTDPRDVESFLFEMEEPLGEMNIGIQLPDTDWENFSTSSDAMVQTLNSSLKIFTGVSLLALILAVFIYVRRNRRGFAITRALGVPAGRAVRWCLAPMLCMSVIGVCTGTFFAWKYAIKEAAETLACLEEGIMVSVSTNYLLIISGVLCGMLLLFTIISLLMVSNKKVLELLQGGGQRHGKR